MELLELMRNRRSVRRYTEEAIAEEKIEQVIQAGLLSASGHATRPWEFIVVRNKEMLKKLSECKIGAAKMLEGADCAIIVIADENKTDIWVEDCSIAMANMHLMADSLGIGSCFIQGRLREAPSGETTEEYIRDCLCFSKEYRLAAILSMGMPTSHPEPYDIEKLPMGKVHKEKF